MEVRGRCGSWYLVALVQSCLDGDNRVIVSDRIALFSATTVKTAGFLVVPNDADANQHPGVVFSLNRSLSGSLDDCFMTLTTLYL